jgi:hypothetical protein
MGSKGIDSGPEAFLTKSAPQGPGNCSAEVLKIGAKPAQLHEPGAQIGSAGPRVIEQSIRQKLPEGFQRSEFLLEHGFLDAIVKRSELKSYIAQALSFFCD